MSVAVSTSVIVPAAVAVGLIIIAIALFKAMWRVAEPNEALIISGLRDKEIAKDSSGDEMGFRIVTGKGTMVLPGVQAVRRLSLDLHQADLQVVRASGRDQACLISQDDRLHAAAEPELRQQRADMGLDGRLLNRQGAGDVGIAQSVGDVQQDLVLAPAQLGEPIRLWARRVGASSAKRAISRRVTSGSISPRPAATVLTALTSTSGEASLSRKPAAPARRAPNT